mmetsp:Transcript_22635/g.43239  ORF Transcript_22635/g.43239 Transcript_22635/m.43239 type:complete len:323 (+) Transcript_22635:316-1284(+)
MVWSRTLSSMALSADFTIAVNMPLRVNKALPTALLPVNSAATWGSIVPSEAWLRVSVIEPSGGAWSAINCSTSFTILVSSSMSMPITIRTSRGSFMRCQLQVTKLFFTMCASLCPCASTYAATKRAAVQCKTRATSTGTQAISSPAPARSSPSCSAIEGTTLLSTNRVSRASSNTKGMLGASVAAGGFATKTTAGVSSPSDTASPGVGEGTLASWQAHARQLSKKSCAALRTSSSHAPIPAGMDDRPLTSCRSQSKLLMEFIKRSDSWLYCCTESVGSEACTLARSARKLSCTRANAAATYCLVACPTTSALRCSSSASGTS